MFTEAERRELMQGEQTVAVAKPNYKKIDRDVYRDNITAVNQAGYSLDSLKEQYKKIPFNSFSSNLKFGASLAELKTVDELYQGTRGTASKYINSRIEVLNQVIALLQGANSPESLHMIHAFMELSKEAAGSDEQKAAHYQELVSAAQQATSNDTEARKLFKDFKKSFLYDPASLSKTINELVRRRDHLVAIQGHGFSSDGFVGFADGIATEGLEAAGVGASTWTLAQGGWGVIAHYKEGTEGAKTLQDIGIKNARHLKQLEQQLIAQGGTRVLGNGALAGKITKGQTALAKVQKAGWLSKAFRGLVKSHKWAWKAFKALPIGRMAAVIGAGIYGAALVTSSLCKEEGTLHSVGNSLKELYMGDAQNGWAAALNWTIPFYDSLIGWGMKDSKTEALQKLQQGVLA